MADDTPEMAALKAQKTKAEAERDVAKAELEKLQAQQKLADTVAGTDVIAQLAKAKAEAEAQTALYNQQKAAADAQAAALGSEAAAIKAKYGTVSGSSITGSITTEAGAGNGEASLLAAQAVDEAAIQITKALAGLPSGKRYVVFAGQQRPAFGHWRVFRVQSQVVEEAFTKADDLLGQAKNAAAKIEAPTKIQSGPQPGTESVAAAVTGAGAVLDLASKLGSYFMTDYKIAGLTVAGSDDDLLAVSVVGRLNDAWFPARWTAPAGTQPVSELLRPLRIARDSSITKLKEAQDGADQHKSTAEKESDPRKKEMHKNVAAAFGRALDGYVSAQKRFDDLLSSLAAVDKEGVPFVSLVIDQKLISEALEQGAYALFVRLNAATGGYYTKKNLWTFFGSMPFNVSAGAVASFVAIDGSTGVVKKAGQFSIHSGYHKINDVSEQFRIPPN